MTDPVPASDVSPPTVAAVGAADAPPRGAAWSYVLAALPAFLLAVVAMVVCHRTVGPTLGFFFGGVMLAAIVVPLLVVGEDGQARPWGAAAGAVAGVAAVWLWVTLRPHLPGQPYPDLGDWFRCTLVLAAFAFCLAAGSLLLRAARVTPALAGFLVLLLGMAWLTWPVWLSPWLSGRGRLVAWLVPAHPLLAVNGVVRHISAPWDEHPLAYNLTVLNRDVSYPLPEGVFATVALHVMVGTLALLPFVLRWGLGRWGWYSPAGQTRPKTVPGEVAG